MVRLFAGQLEIYKEHPDMEMISMFKSLIEFLSKSHSAWTICQYTSSYNDLCAKRGVPCTSYRQDSLVHQITGFNQDKTVKACCFIRRLEMDWGVHGSYSNL